MRLQVLCEDHRYSIKPTRDYKGKNSDFAKIKELYASVNNGKAYQPSNNHIVIVAKDGDRVIGFAVAKPFREIAYKTKHSAVHPAYKKSGVMHDIVKALVDTCKSLGFKYSTARADPGDSDITEVYGDHVSSIKYPTKVVNIHRIDHSKAGPHAIDPSSVKIGRQTQRVPGRAAPIYKS